MYLRADYWEERYLGRANVTSETARLPAFCYNGIKRIPEWGAGALAGGS